jgi:autotransporter-associated beta strand protein
LLVKQGAGTLVLGGASTYSGETFINNGKIQLSTSSDRLPTTTILNLGQAASANLGTFDLNGQSQQIAGLVSTTGTNAAATKNTVTSATAATLMINVPVGVTRSYGDGTLANSGVIAGALSLVKSGSGTQVLGDANTYSGTTTISAGTLTLSGANTFTGAVTINGGTLSVGSIGNGAVASGNLGSATSAAANLVLNGGTLQYTGTGTTSSDRNFTLGTSGGTIDIAAASGTFTLSGSATLSGTNTARTLTLTSSSGALAGVFSGTLGDNGTGATSLIKTGSNTWTLSGANTFTGTTTVSAGTLLVNHLTALGTGAVTVNGGTLDLNATTIGQIANVITVTSGLVIGGAAASAAPTSGTVAVTTVLTGAADLTKADAGTLTLSTPHFHTGATVANVAGAVIRASHLADTGSSLGAGTLTDPTKLQLGAGAVLEFTGATTTTSTRSFTVTDSAGITTAAGAAGLTFTAAAKIALVGATPALALVANNSVTNFFRASLSDADIAAGNGLKTLTIDGAGAWVIGGSSNRFKGDLRIDAAAGSTIGLESSALPSGAGTNVVIALANNARARYEAGNTDDLSGQLSLAAGATGKLDLGNNNVAFNSALAVTTGTGSTATLSKEGSGKLTIAAGNNTNLNVAVTAGTLVVNSSLGNVTLASGTTLGGAGTVGAVTTVSGSTISPGNSPGNLTSSSLALVGGSIFQWQVQDATAAAGTGYDTLTVTNALDLSNANSGNRIILNISSLAGNGNGTALGNPLNFGPSSIRPFTFATVGSLNLGSNTNINDAFTITVGDFHYTDGSTSNAGLWALSFAGNTVTLTAVPEPSTYGLGLGALALAAAAIRRRKQKAKA